MSSVCFSAPSRQEIGLRTAFVWICTPEVVLCAHTTSAAPPRVLAAPPQAVQPAVLLPHRPPARQGEVWCSTPPPQCHCGPRPLSPAGLPARQGAPSVAGRPARQGSVCCSTAEIAVRGAPCSGHRPGGPARGTSPHSQGTALRLKVPRVPHLALLCAYSYSGYATKALWLLHVPLSVFCSSP